MFLIKTRCGYGAIFDTNNFKRKRNVSRDTHLELQHFDGALRLLVAVENGELVPFGDHFQLESVAFGAVIAPEVVVVVVQAGGGVEGEAAGVASPDRLERKGLLVEHAFVGGCFPDRGQGAHAVLETGHDAPVCVHPHDGHLVRLHRAYRVHGREIPEGGGVQSNRGRSLLNQFRFFGDNFFLEKTTRQRCLK